MSINETVLNQTYQSDRPANLLGLLLLSTC
jgi:hypothetical protein